jgi:hypothetical protein
MSDDRDGSRQSAQTTRQHRKDAGTVPHGLPCCHGTVFELGWVSGRSAMLICWRSILIQSYHLLGNTFGKLQVLVTGRGELIGNDWQEPLTATGAMVVDASTPDLAWMYLSRAGNALARDCGFVRFHLMLQPRPAGTVT